MTINHLKGFVAEEIAKYHMLKLQYKVVPIGREKIEPELSDLLLFIRGNMAHLNKQSANTFNLFENTISKLPDYAIWKISPSAGENMMTFRFLEVKYRTKVENLKKHATKDKYSLNITIDDDHTQLQLYKYIDTLQKLYGISSGQQKVDDIEFYIYLITIIDGKHTPLIGKIKSSGYSDFYTYLYTPEQLKKENNLKLLWGNDYDIIATYFTNDNNLEYMFNDDFLIPLIGRSNDDVSKVILERLEA